MFAPCYLSPHTNNMSEITAIGAHHAKLLTHLKDKKLCSKLAESKAKKWPNGTGSTRCCRDGHQFQEI